MLMNAPDQRKKKLLKRQQYSSVIVMSEQLLVHGNSTFEVIVTFTRQNERFLHWS